MRKGVIVGGVLVGNGRERRFLEQLVNTAAPLDADTVQRLRDIVTAIPALPFRPTEARDFDTNDGASPRLALRPLTDADIWRTPRPVNITHQTMYARTCPVLDSTRQSDGGEPRCSYLVHYPGVAEDFPRWIDCYLDHHPQIMKHFPRIREIDICMRVDWRDSLPWTRIEYRQRNRLIFDSAAALEAALNYPVRHDMRANFEAFTLFRQQHPLSDVYRNPSRGRPWDLTIGFRHLARIGQL